MKKYSEIAHAAYTASNQAYSDGLWNSLRDRIGDELQQAYLYWTAVQETGNVTEKPHFQGDRPLAEAWYKAYNELDEDLQDVYFEDVIAAIRKTAGGENEAVQVFFGCMYAEAEGPGAAIDFILRS